MSNAARTKLTLKPASPAVHEAHWNADGSASAKAPKWAKYRTEMSSEFPSPFRGGKDVLAKQIEKFIEKIDLYDRKRTGRPTSAIAAH